MGLFYVFQGETYEKEKSGGYVWSPKLSKNGAKNAGFTNMMKIKKGDFILHNKNGKVVAISVANSDYEETAQPKELQEGQTSDRWEKDGYRVALTYYPFDEGLKTSDFRQWLIDNHKENSAFTKSGRGKQQYMCTLDEEHAVFILENAIDKQTSPEVLIHLKGALGEIINDKESEYDQIEKDMINIAIDDKSAIEQVADKISDNFEQATMLSDTTGRIIPKRNPKKAIEALILADYKCEYNEEDRTFLRKNGKRYTEPHHLIPISKYKDFDRSLDVKENIVSLCSHCHNLLHYGRDKDKQLILSKIFNDRKDKLQSYGISISLEELSEYYK